MKDTKRILKFQIFSGVLVSILGTLLHFTYEWSGENTIVGIFSAVNESTWEHLKLLFFPMLLTTIIGYFYTGKNIQNYLCARTIGTVISMLFTVVFFYTYSGIIGRIIDWVNIVSFFVAVIIGEYIAYKIMLSDFKCNKKAAVITWIVIFICFLIFTNNPLELGLFKDPTSGGLHIIF